MPTPEATLHKVKLLLNLATSPNVNEAANAKALADKLIEKYKITPEELDTIKDKPQGYSPDALLFKTFSVVSWMQQLALGCAKQFYCHVIMETVQAATGLVEYNYYVYGDDPDVVCTKFAFNTFLKKIHELLDTKCIGRGPVYRDSYCEGAAEAVKNNLAMFGIEMPERVQPTRAIPDNKTLNNGNANLARSEKEPPKKPEEKTVDVNQGHIIKDVMAYFKGLEDGNRISLQDILELEAENEEAQRLQESTESTEEVPKES